MAAKEVLSLDEIVPQALVPQVGDTYEMPRDVNITGNLTVTGTIPAHNQAWSTITTTPTTMAGYGISDTKANFNTACSDGSFMFVGDAPTAHTHPYTVLEAGTAGELITWSNLGAIETVATGTATHVLTSNGLGLAPTFQAPAGGGWANMSAAVWAGGTQSEVADGATAVAFNFDTDAAYSTAGSKVFNFSNNGTPIFGMTLRGSGLYSMVVGGNSATKWGALAGGNASTASGSATVAWGNAITVSGNESAAFGKGHTIAASSCGAVGEGNSIDPNSTYCFASGSDAKIAIIQCASVIGARKFAATGDAQVMTVAVKKATTDATQTTLTTGVLTSYGIKIPADTTWAFSALIAARSDEADGNNAAIYKIEGGLKRDESNNTALVGTPTVTVIAEDTDAIPWSVDCVADDTNEALAIRVTGEAATNIRWVAKVDISQVSFA